MTALTERQQAKIGPRDQKVKGSPEWCLQTLEYLKIRWAKKEDDVKVLEGVLAEIESAKVWEVIPVGNPYGSLDALLAAEIGASGKEVAQEIELLNWGGDRKSKGAREVQGRITTLKGRRAADQGVNNTLIRGSTNAEYLTARLKRDHPDIHARLLAGEYPSVRAAALEAGIIKQRFSIPADCTGVAAVICRHFDAAEIKEIVRLLRWRLGETQAIKEQL